MHVRTAPHTVSDVKVAACSMYCVSNEHVVTLLQRRSDVDDNAATSYWLALQTVALVHWRSVVDVGTADSNSSRRLHVDTVRHERSEDDVGAVASYSVIGLHTRVALHTLSVE